MNDNFARRLFAEILGTGFLTAGVVGSSLMASSVTNDLAIIQLCTAVSCSAVLFVILELLGPVSGGHFNPVVTVAMLSEGMVSRRDAGIYICGQVAGGLVGIAVTHLMFGLPLLAAAVHGRSGFACWFAEGFSTFGLILTILLGMRFRPQTVPAIVGAYVLSVTLFSSSSLANPALTIARSLTDTISGIIPADAPVFVLAQFLGCLLAVGVSRWLLPGDETEKRLFPAGRKR